MSRSLLAASTFVSVALLLSRVSGLIREQVLGARLGLSAETDAAILMLTLPDLLVGLLLAGGFSAALVPALTKVEPVARIVLMRRVMGWTAAGGLLIAGALFLAAPLVLAVLAPALDPGSLVHFRMGFAVSLMALPIAAVIGVATAYLSAVGKYTVPALSVLAFNVALAGYFLVGLSAGAVNFAVFGGVILAACALRLAVQFSRMTEVLRPPSEDHVFAAGFRALFAQGVFAYALIVGIPVLFRSLYASGGPGDLAAFNYALRVFELPAGILIAPIVVVFLPLLSALPGPDDPVFRDRTDLAMRVAFAVGLIAALIAGLFAQPIVTVLFGFGEMGTSGADQIAVVLQKLAVAIPFFAVFQVMATALNASGRTRLVLAATLGGLAVSLAAYVVLSFGFGLGVTSAAELGFVSYHISACCFAILAVRGALGLGRTLVQLAPTVCVTVPFAVAVVTLNPWLTRDEVSLWEVVPIVLLGLCLLVLHAPLLIRLAQLRDTRRMS
ncbi:lipid II flippase MurJ [uncultured Roseobacter sp.]|uniref:lipid II flippase MurJ n=1 Tax=uncultured Roseobacter sp. TaxID=114847 RepID=UPI0026395804|nr:lipid II flippase MurJ [uncultured Roseobacter sp.]